MLIYIYKHFVTREQKLSLKRKYYRTQKFISDAFFSYNREDLNNACRVSEYNKKTPSARTVLSIH